MIRNKYEPGDVFVDLLGAVYVVLGVTQLCSWNVRVLVLDKSGSANVRIMYSHHYEKETILLDASEVER